METQTNNQNPQSKAVAWLGVTGSTLLILSATIFVWSQWQTFDNALKFGIIALITAVCFGMGQWLAKSLPVMGSIFTHLSIFMTPIVLLSINMEGFFEWRPFLIFEGIFSVVLFYVASKFIKSPIFLSAAILSTVMIALGLASLEATPLGSVPAAIYMLPVVIALSLIPKLTKASIATLIIVGFSPAIAIFQPYMEVGKEVVAGFGLGRDVDWYYSIIVALGLLVATVLNARTQKSLRILSLIPAVVLPYALLSLLDENFGVNDFYLVIPVILLIIQALLFFLKDDDFFKNNMRVINNGFNATVLIVQGYVALIISLRYMEFLLDNYDNSVAFFELRPAIGLLLMICVGIGVRLNGKNTIQDFFLGFLGMFGVGAFLDLTQLIDTSQREVRMLIAATVVSLACIVLKKNYLVAVLSPLTLIATYVSLSENTYNIVRFIAFIGFFVALVYGLYVIRRTREDIFWLASCATAIVLLAFTFGSLEYFFPANIDNFDLIRISFIFLIGLVVTEIFELLGVGTGYLFTTNSGIKFLRPARVLMILSYVSTWFIGFSNEYIPAVIFAFTVALTGVFGTWRRQESLPMMLVAPTLIAGVYSFGHAFNLESSVAPIFVVIASLSLLGATYNGYATTGFIVNSSLFGIFGFFESFNDLSSLGQSLFIFGLILIAIGIARNRAILIPFGVASSIMGLWITLIVEEVTLLLAYAAPISIGLIALGMYSRKIFPGQDRSTGKVPNSWSAYALPIVLFQVAVLSDSFQSGESIYSLIGGVVAVAAIAIGAWRKLAAPMVLGTLFLVVFILREIFRVASAVPIWAWIGAGAITLIITAVVLEKSQISASTAKNKLKVVVSDDFQ